MKNASSSLPFMRVGLIPDGTRRWAHQNGVDYLTSYKKTMIGINEFIDHMFTKGSSAISIYLLSKENLQRKPEELASIFEAEIEFIAQLITPNIIKHKCSVVHAGNADLLPSKYMNALNHLVHFAPQTSDRHLYLLAAYNPLDEFERALSDSRIHNTQNIFDRFWVSEPLDLVVRTGGEQRLSNFLPLQSAYAELVFVNKLFNDFTTSDLENILQEFQTRNRRFGR